MPLRKKILYSFVAVVAVGIVQMITMIGGLARMGDISTNLKTSNIVMEHADKIGRLNEQLLALLTRYVHDVRAGEDTVTLSKRIDTVRGELKTAIDGIKPVTEADKELHKQLVARLAAHDEARTALYNKLQELMEKRGNINNDFVALVTSCRSSTPELSIAAYQANSLWQGIKSMSPRRLSRLTPEELTQIDNALAQAKLAAEGKGEDVNTLISELSQAVKEYPVAGSEIGSGQSYLSTLEASTGEIAALCQKLVKTASLQLEARAGSMSGNVQQLTLFTLLVGVVSIAIGMGLALLLTREILKPIEEFRMAADRVSRGDTDVELPDPKTQDELAELSKSFQRMLNSLRALMAQDYEEEMGM